MQALDVYAIGNALVDVEYRVETQDLRTLGIDKGVMTLVDADEQARLMDRLDGAEVKRSAGGSAANTVIAVSQFGGSGFYGCRVGDDDLGSLYTSDLAANGVETNADRHREHGPTGRCLVFVTPDADRTMHTFLGVTGNLDGDVLDGERLRASGYLYIEGYLATSDAARTVIAEARDIAHAAGVRTALSLSDPNIVNLFREGLMDMIGPGLDLVFANEDEALGLSKAEDLEGAVEWMKGIAESFYITRGPRDAVAWDGNRLLTIPALDVEALDTLGAGDMFAGACLYGLSRGWDHARAGTLGNAAAARLITEYGARFEPGIARAVLERFD